MYIGDGAQMIRRGTVPNGNTVLLNAAGSYADNGTVTATNSDGTVSAPEQTTAQYVCTASRSYRNSYNEWRDEQTIYQGNYGYGTHWGCMDFDGAHGLTGTVVSARLYLKRTGSGGSSGAQPIKLYATTNITAIPTRGGDSSLVPTLAAGGSNNTTVCSLAWNVGGWYDIPIYFAQQAIAGKALCIYTNTSYYAILYGADSQSKPILEITRQLK
jgi:hypothetical protein